MKRDSRKKRVAAWIALRNPIRVGAGEVEEAAKALPDVPAKELRRLLRDCGLPCEALVEGVRQSSFEELERTLLALSNAYEQEPATARMLVIEAKDHAKFAWRRLTGEARAERERMMEWMLIWLENPPLFPAWNAARRARLSS